MAKKAQQAQASQEAQAQEAQAREEAVKASFPDLEQWQEFAAARAWAAVAYWREQGSYVILFPTAGATILARLDILKRYPKNARMASILVERLRERLKA